MTTQSTALLWQNDKQRLYGRNQQHFHSSRLLLAHDGDGSHHCANQHQDKPHNTGNKIIGTLHLRIIKQFDLGHNGGYAYSGRKHILSGHGDDIVAYPACMVAILGSVASEIICTPASPV